MRIGDGAHDVADGQAVEIVVDEDKDAQEEGGQLCAAACLHMLARPLAECVRGACAAQKRGNDSQGHEEDEDAGADLHGGDDACLDNDIDGVDGLEVCDKQASEEDADEEGGVDLLRDEGEPDCDDWRQNRPQGSDKPAGLGGVLDNLRLLSQEFRGEKGE